MKQAKEKVRYFRNGLIIAAMFAVLVSCGEVPQGLEAPKAPTIGEKTGDVVSVKVSVSNSGKANSGRSVSADSVEFAADSYEVVFRKSGASTAADYYRGTGTADLGGVVKMRGRYI